MTETLAQFEMRDLYEKHDKLQSGEIVLDVRTREEYAEGHVPGSLNIPHDEVEKHLDELRKYKRIYMHCRSGKRAGMAYEALNRAGLKNVVCISGSGMMDWIEAGYPLKK